jgi:hypothetical protein
MLEVLSVVALLGACAWVACRAFASPRGVYMRSAIGAGLTVAAALAVWWAASPIISNEAGFGAFVLFCVAVLLGAGVALVACLAATLRHLCDALGLNPGRG